MAYARIVPMIHLPPFETFLHYGAGFVLGYWLVRIILKAIRMNREEPTWCGGCKRFSRGAACPYCRN